MHRSPVPAIPYSSITFRKSRWKPSSKKQKNEKNSRESREFFETIRSLFLRGRILDRFLLNKTVKRLFLRTQIDVAEFRTLFLSDLL